jgi:putative transposase
MELRGLLKIKSMGGIEEKLQRWVEESLGGKDGKRESRWRESVAVGRKPFVEKTKKAESVSRRLTEKSGELMGFMN